MITHTHPTAGSLPTKTWLLGNGQQRVMPHIAMYRFISDVLDALHVHGAHIQGPRWNLECYTMWF